MARGPRKSRDMGSTSLLRLTEGFSVVFDWGAYSEGNEQAYSLNRDGGVSPTPRTGEHLGGFVVSVAKNAQESVYTGQSGQRVMVGVEHDDRVADRRLVVGGSVPLNEALRNPALRDNGWDIYGEPYDIGGDRSYSANLRQAAAVIIAQQLST